eukprot:g31447.t1
MFTCDGVLPYSLYTYKRVAKFRTNAIYKFADDTTMVGLILNNDELEYREEIEGLALWYNDNNLSLNISKTKELIIDFRKKGAEHTPICINRAEFDSVKFPGVTITNNLSWTSHLDATAKKAQQHLFFLRQLRKFGDHPMTCMPLLTMICLYCSQTKLFIVL